MERFTEDNLTVKNLPTGARRDWAVAATVGGSEKAGWDYLAKAGWRKAGHKWELMAKGEPAGEKFSAPVRLAKAEKEGDDLYVTLVASGFGVDRQNEKMEKSAMDRMIATCKAGTVGMRESHHTTFPIAKSVDAFLDERNEMQVKMKLEKAHPMAGYVFERVASGEASEQASVYGSVTSKDYVWDADNKRMVKSIKDVALSFIDLTPPGESAYKGAGFVEAIAKQVSWDPEPKAPVPEGPRRGETMEDLIKQLEALSEAMAKSMAPDFTVEAHMIGKDGSLKKDYREALEKGRKSIDKAQMDRLNKAVAGILETAGVEAIEAPTGEIPAEPETLSKRKLVKKLAKALGADKDTLAKALGIDLGTAPAAAVAPEFDSLKKQLAEQGELLKKIAATPAGARPAAGDGKLLSKETPAGDGNMTLADLSKSMVAIGQSFRSGALTADGQANAKAALNSYVARVAEAAIKTNMASSGAPVQA